MSGLLRFDALQAGQAVSLSRRLELIGIMVPDQKEVARMMIAARRGFHPKTSPLRVACSTFGRFRRDFTRLPFRAFDQGYVCRNFGGEPPREVRDTVHTIRSRIPSAEFTVYAKYEDPWLEVRDGDEALFVHGWYSDPSTREVELIV